ncbi:MAG: CBS domain-containing protein [Deltaproteobacteria bacterium]|nr:CBS domain-containing protein [Deltaproteobacteria bacterium]MBW2136990.1 CBS domain-containing protein [Deltaproteobacteria bacterium]
MKIKDLMIPNPITITRGATIEEAIEVMKANSIRHLPVVKEDDKLDGFVTLSDLKTGLIPSMVAGVTLEDLVIRDPIAVNPDDDVEIAAQLIYKHKIGGMPVVKDGRVVGIITESDILRAFVDMMGILTSSSRIDVVVGNEPGALKRALQIIHDNGGEIINVGITAERRKKKAYYFRLAPCDTRVIKEALEKEGMDVVTAMD